MKNRNTYLEKINAAPGSTRAREQFRRYQDRTFLAQGLIVEVHPYAISHPIRYQLTAKGRARIATPQE